MTKEEKKEKIKADLKTAKFNFIEDRKGHTHRKQLREMVIKRFGKY